jgi:hypothetical protein
MSCYNGGVNGESLEVEGRSAGVHSLCFIQIGQYTAENIDQGNLTVGSPATIDCEQSYLGIQLVAFLFRKSGQGVYQCVKKCDLMIFKKGFLNLVALCHTLWKI